MTLLLEHLGSRPPRGQLPPPLSPASAATTTFCSNSYWVVTPPPRAWTADTDSARCPIVTLILLL